MREVLAKLKRSESILIIISQSRANIGFGFVGKSRSGGHSLKFYCHCETWTSVVGTIKKTVNGKPRKLGIIVKAKIDKNRQTGRSLDVRIPIYWSFGIDEVGSCIDYLLFEKHWRKSSQGIIAKEFEVTFKREELVKHIEDNDLEAELRAIVGEVWKKVQDACSLERKKRYD